MEFVVVGVDDPDLIEIARAMFSEYREAIGVGFVQHGYPEELANMPGKYGPPSGCLLLVYERERPIACGALRDLGDGYAELKRIYVRPEARRRGLARTISSRLIEFGRDHGYRAIRLDTLRRLAGAYELYLDLGFTEIEAYNSTQEPDIVYMELQLT